MRAPAQPIHEMAEGILAGLARSGVDHVWFTSGSELTCFQEAAAKARSLRTPAPRIMTVVHEHVAACIAMGESMVTGLPSSVAAHADLGLLSYGGAIHNAALGEFPLFVITGYPATTPSARTSPVFWKQQRWDQGSIVRQYVKWDHKLATYDDPCMVVARGLQIAQSAPSGPVYLAVPAEVGRHHVDRDVEVLAANDLGIARLGGGDRGQLAELATWILNADNPLFITDRVGRQPEAVDLLAAIAEEFAIAVQATRHRMNLADSHPSKHSGLQLAEADVVVVLDHLVPWIPAKEQPSSCARICAVGPDPTASNIPLYEFRADHRIVADPARFLAELLDELRRQRSAVQRSRAKDRWRHFQRGAAEHEAAAERVRASVGRQPVISEPVLGAALNAVLDPDAICTWELSDTEHVQRDRPGTLFEKGGSSLGWAVAAAIGARIVDRQRPAACLTGDGSYMFGSSQALLWAQGQYDAPVLTVVCNNRGYRTGTTTLKANYPDGHAVMNQDFSGGVFDPPPDFAAEAEAQGGYGRRVLDGRDLRQVLADARNAVEIERRPAVVDVWLPALADGTTHSPDPRK